MRPFKFLAYLCTLLLTIYSFRSNAQSQKETIGSFTYKLGDETVTVPLKSLSVKFKTETFGDPGKEKSHTSVAFTVYTTDKGKAFKFSIKEDQVVNELKGTYPLRAPGGIQEGESLRSVSAMVVDTQNSSNTFMSMKPGIATISISGTSVRISIKNTKLVSPDKELPFEFTLTTDQAKIKTEP